MGIRFYEIQGPTWPVAIRDRIQRSFFGNGRGFSLPKTKYELNAKNVKH
jgi:hypothetical protein